MTRRRASTAAAVAALALLGSMMTACSSSSANAAKSTPTTATTSTTIAANCAPAAPSPAARRVQPGSALAAVVPRAEQLAPCLHEVLGDRTAAYPDPCTQLPLFSATPPVSRVHVDFATTLGSFVSIQIGHYRSIADASNIIARVRRESSGCKRYSIVAGSKPTSGRVSPVGSPAIGEEAVSVDVLFTNGVLQAVNELIVTRVQTDVAEVISGWALGRGIPAAPVAKLVAARLVSRSRG